MKKPVVSFHPDLVEDMMSTRNIVVGIVVVLVLGGAFLTLAAARIRLAPNQHLRRLPRSSITKIS